MDLRTQLIQLIRPSYDFIKQEVKVKDGVLADVAPTILDLMGIDQPAEMTGSSLLS